MAQEGTHCSTKNNRINMIGNGKRPDVGEEKEREIHTRGRCPIILEQITM
jgi:hypothetical protein